jgi:hypothetical protein
MTRGSYVQWPCCLGAHYVCCRMGGREGTAVSPSPMIECAHRGEPMVIEVGGKGG